MHHIMCSDSYWRFTLAVTIGGAQLRMWFTYRSTILVSRPFNFIMVRYPPYADAVHVEDAHL